MWNPPRRFATACSRPRASCPSTGWERPTSAASPRLPTTAPPRVIRRFGRSRRAWTARGWLAKFSWAVKSRDHRERFRPRLTRLPPPTFPRSQMRPRHIGINLYSIPRLVLNRKIAFLPYRSLVNHQVRPPIDPIREFMNPKVPHGRGRVRRCDGPNRASRIVRRRPDAIARRKVRNAFGFQQTAGFRNVDVNAVAALQFDEFLESRKAIEIFAGAYWHGRMLAHHCHHLWIFRRHWCASIL